MKITETRKAIIELIEPFMDKTLSEGCLLKNEKFGFAKIEFGNKETSLEGKMIALINGKIDWITIGHYDITAVILYIGKKIDSYKVDITSSVGILIFKYFNISIPNKPLLLYTEKEDKDLLVLLNNLK